MNESPQSHYQGLTSRQVEEQRRLHGSNVLTPKERESLWLMFARKFQDPLIIILLVALALSFGIACFHHFGQGDDATVFLEPAGVLLAILLATGAAFYFEMKSEREFEILNQVNDDIIYKVYRDGQLQQVLRGDIVVGDIITLEAGEEIPADGTLLECVALSVDESSLTGEPMMMKTTREEDFDEEATYPSNYICRGTTILDGHCLYRAEKVGDATEYGQVFEGAQIDTGIETPLNRQLKGLVHLITWVAYGIAALVLVGSAVVYASEGRFADFDLAHALEFFLGKIMVAVTIIVVAVPEGLPMSVTLSLAASMRSMMKTNNLVRKMHACETMGAATVICTDKTGTLTQNRMSIADTSFAPEYATSELLRLSMAVNSTAHLDLSNGQKPSALGNPTEGALLLWLHQSGIDYQELRQRYPVRQQLTFSTERKYMATIIEHEGRPLLCVKGAPEIVMGLCTLAPEGLEAYKQQLLAYQNKAYRTIGFAYTYLDSYEPAWENGRLSIGGLSFMGIVGISDPIRSDVPEAIARCMQAGIQVKIVTGDTPGTAKEIGRQIGLWDESCSDERNLITGVEFAALSDEELRPRVADLRIMSRARPMDKERLVRLLQEAGEVVAVTGDGTNDAPALSRAQVGLSMGDGTAVAKEASDITILDGSFSSITQAVIWGRSLYLNIQRFILFQMTINVAACLIVLVGAFLGTESPLTVTQMLWVNIIMDTFAALALASLPPSERVMTERPRKQSDNIISPEMGTRIVVTGLVFVALLFGLVQYFNHNDLAHVLDFDFATLISSALDFGGGTSGLSGYEMTILFSFFVLLQFWNMFNAKAYRGQGSAFSGLAACRNFLLIAFVILVGQVLITTFGGTMFRVQPLDLSSWLVLLGSTSLVLVLGELSRLFKR
ncbi:MAG: calcium-translocating P-type ATPase, PMCA-type [Porphyromonas sp.]|nr:calcium-translocating P-type ATPase, PMCA-type [Porphyromonas sp.]